MAQEKRDYYEVLGVSKTATDAEIKKAKQEASVAKALLQQEQKQLKQLILL